MAVNRRVVVTAKDTGGDEHVLRAPGLQTGRWRFRSVSGAIEWLDGSPLPGTFALFERLWSQLPPSPGQAYSLVLDSSAAVDPLTGRKLGVGASAAIAVALAAVLARLAGVADKAEAAALAHLDAQGQRGSGVDIACSRHGGLIEYRRSQPYRPERLCWPRGLHCAFLWSGTPASTADKLRSLEQSDPGAGSAASLDALVREARLVAAAWRHGTASTVIGVLGDYVRALQRFDSERRIGIFGAGHAELLQHARPSGVVYKPCGAGGGDIGAVFATDPEAAAEFVSRATGLGFRNLELRLDDNGVTTMNTAAP